MIDPESREIFGEIYRLYERHEKLPDTMDSQVMTAWWEHYARECNEIHQRHQENKLAEKLLLAIYEYSGDQYQKKQGGA